MADAMMGRVRVLHCAETIKGGVASYLRDLLSMQVRDFGRNAVVVIVPRSQLDQLFAPTGVHVLSFNDGRSRFVNALKMLMTVIQAWLKYRPEIGHLHSTFAGAAVRSVLGPLGLRRRLIYCPHGWAWDRESSRISKSVVKAIERILTCFCARVICISSYEKKCAVEAGLPADKLSIVLNGVSRDVPETPENLPVWPMDGKRLLFVGRFDQQKGVDVFCAALRLLDGYAQGTLVGGAVLNDGMVIDVPPNARTVGWVNASELQGFFQTADVLVVPSRWEGFGLIATEAMRAGLPVIASRVGGLAEVVLDDETGVLVKPDDPVELAQAIRRSEDDWKDMGRKGRLRFESHFTFERVHSQITEIYDSLGVQRVAAFLS